MKTISFYVFCFCVILGLISFKVKQTKDSERQAAQKKAQMKPSDCNCFQFVNSELRFKGARQVNSLSDLVEELKAEGYSPRSTPKKGDIALIKKGFGNEQFSEAGHSAFVYEVLRKKNSAKFQLRGAQIESGRKFRQGLCKNVSISGFIPLTEEVQRKITFWGK